MQKRSLYIPICQLNRGGNTRYTKRYQSVNYTEEVRQGIQKRYLYIPISQLDSGGKKRYTEEVPIYTNLSITQRR
jgi:hypothetical protein